MEIKVLGPGCAKCKRLYDDVCAIVKEMGVDARVAKVDDLDIIASYGVFLTPGLVIDGEVKMAGRVPKKAEIKQWVLEHAEG